MINTMGSYRRSTWDMAGEFLDFYEFDTETNDVNDPKVRTKFCHYQDLVKETMMEFHIETMYRDYMTYKPVFSEDDTYKLQEIREKLDGSKKNYSIEIVNGSLWDFEVVLRANKQDFCKQPAESKWYKRSTKQAIESLYGYVHAQGGQNYNQQVAGKQKAPKEPEQASSAAKESEQSVADAPEETEQMEMRMRILDVAEEFGVNNTLVTRRATHLLALYAKADERFAKLACVVKNWKAKCYDSFDRSGSFPKYAFMLMLIQYLQAGCQPPVLPCLHEQYPEVFKRIISTCALPDLKLDFESQNKQSCGRLLIGFFNYYRLPLGWTIKHSPWRISVKEGKPKYRSPVSKKYQKFMIEDPYSGENVASVDRCHLGPKTCIEFDGGRDISMVLKEVMTCVHAHLYFYSDLDRMMRYKFDLTPGPEPYKMLLSRCFFWPIG